MVDHEEISMSEGPTTAWTAIPGIGVCKDCDASGMDDCIYGEPIPGDQCGGCGAQTYELLRPVEKST